MSTPQMITSAQQMYDIEMDKLAKKQIQVIRRSDCMVGYWSENTLSIEPIQTAKAVQDQFNFGAGAYNADLKLWKMEQNIDVWSQIMTSIFEKDKYGKDGRLKKIFDQAKVNKSVDFNWKLLGDKKGMGFGTNPYNNIRTFAWPFGAVSANCIGSMIIGDDGLCFVSGWLDFESDKYSWIMDRDFWSMEVYENSKHNGGIFLFSECLNYYDPKKGCGYGTWNITKAVRQGLEYKLQISRPPLHPNSTQFNSSCINGTKILDYDFARWGTPSSSYKDGEMPVNYSRKFYFYLLFRG